MIPIASDALVVLQKLKDQDSGLFVDDATVTGELQDILTGDPIISFNFTAKGNGKYHGIIPFTATEDLVDGTNYLIEVVATIGLSQATFHETDVATYQT